MQRFLLLGASAALSACLNQPTLVSITPTHGYYDSDGCYEVELQGHQLGTSASATIGGAEIINFAAAEKNPDSPEWAQDIGFSYSGFVPASATGEPGWADVTMTVDGEKLTLKDGWYYRSCPNDFTIDLISGADILPTVVEAAVGDAITVEGCGIDDSLKILLVDPTGEPPAGRGTPGTPPTEPNPGCLGAVVAELTVENDCGGGIAHVNIPELPPAEYYVHIVHPSAGADVGTCHSDSADTGASTVCDCRAVTIGGAK